MVANLRPEEDGIELPTVVVVTREAEIGVIPVRGLCLRPLNPLCAVCWRQEAPQVSPGLRSMTARILVIRG